MVSRYVSPLHVASRLHFVGQSDAMKLKVLRNYPGGYVLSDLAAACAVLCSTYVKEWPVGRPRAEAAGAACKWQRSAAAVRVVPCPCFMVMCLGSCPELASCNPTSTHAHLRALCCDLHGRPWSTLGRC